MDFLNGILIGFVLGVFRKEAVYGLKSLLEYIFNIKPTSPKPQEPKADDKK